VDGVHHKFVPVENLVQQWGPTFPRDNPLAKGSFDAGEFSGRPMAVCDEVMSTNEECHKTTFGLFGEEERRN
jgi:hypothetical protein